MTPEIAALYRAAALGVSSVALACCAQAVRGDADQVYVYNGFALTDTQGIDEASKHCEQYGKIAVYRGAYSGDTKLFACVAPSGQAQTGPAADLSGSDIDKLQHAAEVGDSTAMLKLGLLYSGLLKGSVPPDYPLAMYWLHKAADRGNSNAMLFIGRAYIKGELGVTADPAVALGWLTRAADLGSAPSMFVIGVMYDNGLGVEANKADATRWFQKAADLGYADAIKKLKARSQESKQPNAP